nr:MAG TPA: hypothetical protein [Caudoviricetes sp.]
MPPQFADVLAQLQVLAFGVGDAFVHRLELAVHVVTQPVDRVHDPLVLLVHVLAQRRLMVVRDLPLRGRLLVAQPADLPGLDDRDDDRGQARHDRDQDHRPQRGAGWRGHGSVLSAYALRYE